MEEENKNTSSVLIIISIIILLQGILSLITTGFMAIGAIFDSKVSLVFLKNLLTLIAPVILIASSVNIRKMKLRGIILFATAIALSIVILLSSSIIFGKGDPGAGFLIWLFVPYIMPLVILMNILILTYLWSNRKKFS